MSELKPCPFCGGQAEIERKGTAWQSMQIACNCGCRMESGDVFGLTNSDKWAWNRRSIDCELDATRAQFRRACEKLAAQEESIAMSGQFPGERSGPAKL